MCGEDERESKGERGGRVAAESKTASQIRHSIILKSPLICARAYMQQQAKALRETYTFSCYPSYVHCRIESYMRDVPRVAQLLPKARSLHTFQRFVLGPNGF